LVTNISYQYFDYQKILHNDQIRDQFKNYFSY